MRRFNPGKQEEAALYDAATGLYSRAVLTAIGDEMLEQARRYNFPMSLAIYQMDLISGEAPAEAGTQNEVLHYLGLLLVENLRRCDVAAHFGEGVFAVLMPHTALDIAREVTERMCKTIISSPVILRSGEQMQMLSSGGVATHQKSHSSLEDLVQAAHKDLGRPQRSWTSTAVS